MGIGAILSVGDATLVNGMALLLFAAVRLLAATVLMSAAVMLLAVSLYWRWTSAVSVSAYR